MEILLFRDHKRVTFPNKASSMPVDGLSRNVTVSRKAMILFIKGTADAVDLPMRPARCYLVMQFCIRELRF
jgi:hypothetical protein